MSLFETISLNTLGDERGTLTVVEALKTLPFDIKRVYYLKNLVANIPRGFHAHYKLQQFAICLAGSCEMVFDDGVSRELKLIDSSSEGVLIPPMVWHEMHNFTEDCIFLVLASDLYDENDYIRDYQNFMKVIKSDS
ncbi:sugar 3,4-ketoisomerase [Pseudoalteromonas piscicida]|uniref:sugar 3,4-ketoisomerase n=1 Tax=Pseudoalteromonas piscicida TaxID=43662 RepID=UPI000E35FA4D|nr:FdtA/QdtA family cupin domain-containing protein [Pseudoalteromonas piscicida]AXQ99048.1 WxcM-like domain-containing protein [Pseudoalteromonas piscicida]